MSFVQISVFVLHNLFEGKTSGYLLLKVLRCYVEIDMYASFQVHTEHTIAAGQQQVTQFYLLLAVCFNIFLIIPNIAHDCRHIENVNYLKTTT